MTVKLIHPIAMNEGLRFAIREGGHTVGAGVVSKIIKQLKAQYLGFQRKKLQNGRNSCTAFAQASSFAVVIFITQLNKMFQRPSR